MNNRQLVIIIAATTLLALALAWTIERAQVRRFMQEFAGWYEKEFGGEKRAD